MARLSLTPKSTPPLAKEYLQQHPQYVLFTSSLAQLMRSLCSTDHGSAEISSRTKDPASLEDKLDRKGYTSLAEIPDLSGIRVIVQYQSAVQAICDMLGDEFNVHEDVSHAFDKPEAFGYASRHVIVSLKAPRTSLPEWSNFVGLRCEIQVRTILQHAWASISHSLDYKHGTDAPAQVRRQLFQVAALIEVSDGLFEDFKNGLAVVRDEYQATMDSGDWRNLPVNIDSLHASWQDWYPRGLNGYIEHLQPTWAAEALTAPDLDFLSQVATLSEALNIQTVGDLAAFLEDGQVLQDFKHAFNPGGEYTFDYLTLLSLYIAAAKRDGNVVSGPLGARFRRSLKPLGLETESGPATDATHPKPSAT